MHGREGRRAGSRQPSKSLTLGATVGGCLNVRGTRHRGGITTLWVDMGMLRVTMRWESHDRKPCGTRWLREDHEEQVAQL